MPELSDIYQQLCRKSLTDGTVCPQDIERILTDDSLELLPLLQAVYKVRYHYFQNKVKVHILNNAQSGNCTEDCKYCAQSGKAAGSALSYPMKPDADLITEAQKAYASGAYRYCMVFSGRDLGQKRIDRICVVVKKIKALCPMEICVSAGFLTKEEALRLKAAGVDRYNHNLNTSRHYYPQICTSHDYRNRVETIHIAKSSGLGICSGVIVGMGESAEDVVSMIDELKAVGADSIPINFFIPIEGHRIVNYPMLTPAHCLKILCAFRFAIPGAEIRAAAGREYHLRSLQPLCLFPADSIFAKGYLTTGGDSVVETRRMIEDSGFIVES